MHQVSEQGREGEREMGTRGRRRRPERESKADRLTDGLANMEYFSS